MALIPMASIPAHYAARLGPERLALTYPDGALTWQALDRRSNSRARALADLGVGQDDFVTIALANSSLFHETAFAVWKLGATPHVVSHKLPAAELQAIADLMGPKLIVGAEHIGITGHATLPAEFSPETYADSALEVRMAKSWKAMSSGGSTGRPKIIVDRNPAATDTDDARIDLPSEACLLNPGPLYHNAPFICAHGGLFRGNHVVGMARFDALEALRLIEAHGVRWVMMVPTMMHRIWRLPEDQRTRFDVSSLDMVVHMAAPMPVWLKQKWIDWLGPDRIYELYGGTEATGFTWISGREWLRRKGSVGQLMRGSRARIIGDDGRDCATGEIGEIYLMPEGGPASTYRYIGSQAKKTDDGWETLGDIGWMDADGYLYLADRRTDMIISGGANIFPAEVEAALAEHPGVDTAVVIGLPDDDMGQLVHAIVQPREDWRERMDGQVLPDFMAQKLARYKTPRTYEFVDYSLRDDAGKVRRSQLREQRIQSMTNEGDK